MELLANRQPEPATCSLCLGLLCNLASALEVDTPKGNSDSLASRAISQIVEEIKASQLEFLSFQLNISEPVNFALREHAFWVFMRRNCQNLEKEIRPLEILEEESVPVKVVFRNFIHHELKRRLKESSVCQGASFPELETPPPWFDRSTEQVDILVNFDLRPGKDLQGDNDCSRLIGAIKKHSEPAQYSRLLPQTGSKRRKRFFRQRRHENHASDEEANESPNTTSINTTCTVSRTSLKQLIELLSDKVFEEEVLNLSDEKDLSVDTQPDVYLVSVKVFRPALLVVAGRYVKLSRVLPQTPWILDGERKLESSIAELIAAPVEKVFGPGTTSNFVSSGREDVDVRCLGYGRPFMLELNGYNRTLASMLKDNNVATMFCGNDSEFLQKNANNLSWLGDIINQSTASRVFVRDLQVVSLASATAALKTSEIEKTKRYRAVCWCSNGGLNTERIEHLKNTLGPRLSDELSTAIEDVIAWPPTSAFLHPELQRSIPYLTFGGFGIEQLTPVRVLHRRALISRKRHITWVRLADFESTVLADDAPYLLHDYRAWTDIYPKEELFLLELSCEAGTYVKELVNGDLGRTQPSFSDLFGCQVDLLALDVIAVDHEWPPQL